MSRVNLFQSGLNGGQQLTLAGMSISLNAKTRAVLADGQIDTNELKLIKDDAQSFGLSKQDASNLSDIMFFSKWGHADQENAAIKLTNESGQLWLA